jgi:GTP-binding protein
VITATSGEAVMTHRFVSYEPFKGEIKGRINGSLIVKSTGTAIPYSIDKLQDRGKFFIEPGDEVYEGQVIGEHIRPGDLVINVTQEKKLTNMRASGSDEKMHIAPPIRFSLEEALEYIQADEYAEVTPKNLRIRKIYLNETDRKRFTKELAL